MAVAGVRSKPAAGGPLTLEQAAGLPVNEVLSVLGSRDGGLSAAEVLRRRSEAGPNVVGGHSVNVASVLLRQLRNPLLILLGAAALTSLYVGERTSALIILAIVGLSVGLGFLNEFRSEKAVEALHRRIRHRAVTIRDGRRVTVDVTGLVPGDIVLLDVGDVVPADLRLLAANGLECDEAVLTGESLPAGKSPAIPTDGDLDDCALMGTVVRAGTARGVVVRTGPSTAFGRIAASLGSPPVVTAFQAGLSGFSILLVRVTAVLTGSIFALNWLLGRPPLESALFSLAIAVGLTPQLLPAIVTVSLSLGARRLAQKAVLIKRLVSIEDLGNVQVLFTDKTGTLTEGQISYQAALDPAGGSSSAVFRLGLLCNSAVVEAGELVAGNQVDAALWRADPSAADLVAGYQRIAELPFDYDRRLMSVLVDSPAGVRLLITKGAPEAVLERCAAIGDETRALLGREFDAGARVVAVASRQAKGLGSIGAVDEKDLRLDGLLCFVDAPKLGARESLERLRRLGVTVKVITGDNDRVARKVCSEMGMGTGEVLTGAQIAALDDAQLTAALARTGVFARVTPDQKSRIIRSQRAAGMTVGFLGDGVNDAVALHDADVGISVDTATDVAKDAADIVLLDKDLGILADGVVEGRRIFANTIKYVLMGTSSNFGNMFSAAGASLFLPFLPMTPTQILLNNLLYDSSEMTIPTDHVDEEALERPSHWDIHFIRRFMLAFGPISSLFDFATFGVMLWVFHARPSLFQTGWFVESLATQTLVIFVIRTRRTPFFRSSPSRALLIASLAIVAAGVAIPLTPLGPLFGFARLPLVFYPILVGMIGAYLLLVEGAKSWFFRSDRAGHLPQAPWQHRRIGRLLGRWSPAPR
jgi:P-type Mg2+ transporter